MWEEQLLSKVSDILAVREKERREDWEGGRTFGLKRGVCKVGGFGAGFAYLQFRFGEVSSFAFLLAGGGAHDMKCVLRGWYIGPLSMGVGILIVKLYSRRSFHWHKGRRSRLLKFLKIIIAGCCDKTARSRLFYVLHKHLMMMISQPL